MTNVAIDDIWLMDELGRLGYGAAACALERFWKNKTLFAIVDVFNDFWTH
jgi:hypothetical protein